MSKEKENQPKEERKERKLGSKPMAPEGGAMRNYLLSVQNALAAEWHYLEFAKVYPEQREDYLELADRSRDIRQSLVNAINWESTREWCVPTGTRVHTADCRNTVASAGRVRSPVLTHNARFVDTDRRYERRFEGKLVKIKVKYNSEPLRLTPNHEILISKNVREPQSVWREDFEEELDWVKSRDVTTNDFTAVPRYKKEKDMSIIDNNLATLLGIYTADGWTSSKKSYISFEKDSSDIEYTLDIIERCFGSRPNVTEHRTDSETYINYKFSKIFKQFGTNSKNKHIPMWFMNLPPNKQFSFLDGYIRGDGHISDYFISCSTVSERLALDLRVLFTRLGIINGMRVIEDTNDEIEGRKVNSSNAYRLGIYGDSARRLSEKIDLKYDGGEKVGGEHGYVSSEYVFMPVLEVSEENYKGTVYNLETSPDHSYVLPQATVHNCTLKHWLDCDENGGEAVEKCYRQDMDVDEAMDALKKVNEMIKIQAERMLSEGGD